MLDFVNLMSFIMAPKRQADSSNCNASKKRKAITMEVKLDIIKRFNKGETSTKIGWSLGLSRSTVATIIKDKDRILEHVKGSAPMNSKIITKARINSQNIKVEGEAASGDEKAASEFSKGLAEIIREGGYCAEQVFNVDETGLFWKRLPYPTYIAKEESSTPSHNASKERLTLLLGGNAAGDYKLKPLLVYQAENPKALKGIWKGQLPVIWKANNTAWVTLTVFEDWFSNHFVPGVERYCTSKDIPFKVLLVLDNAPGHPAHLDDFYPNVKVVYLPPNTTALLQPMDQGVIATFKAYYLQKIFCMALGAIERNKDLTLKNFWKSYNILDAVKNIADSWGDVKQTNMNGVWKKLCPQFVNDFHGLTETVDDIIEKVVALSKEINLEVKADDVTELLASHGEELSTEDLVQLEKQMKDEEEDTPTPEPKRFTRQGLAAGFDLIKEGLSRFEAEDPSMDRCTKVARGVMDCLRCYQEILEEKKMVSFRTNFQQYFKKIERPTRDPVPSTSAAASDLPAPVSPASSAVSASLDSSAPVSPAPSVASSSH